MGLNSTSGTHSRGEGSMSVVLVFRTRNAREWVVSREFKDEAHMNNFIAYIRNKFGYELDEVYK